MTERAGSRPLEPDQEALLAGQDATLFRRLSRNISHQGGAMSSVLRRAFSTLRRTDTSDSEHSTAGEIDIETGALQTSGTEQLPSPAGDVSRSASAPASAAESQGSTGEAARAASAESVQATGAEIVSAPAEVTETGAAAAIVPTAPASTTHSLLGRLLRTNSGGITSKGSGNQQPVCLICLENLGPDDFESGEAMQLDCQCRGELAMRHRICAEKWSRVKGDRMCDVCKAPIMNLPDIMPRPPGSAGTENEATLFDDGDGRDHGHGLHGAYINDQIPGSADVIFDCIRVTWVAMIICILFFEMSLAMALWTGLIVGLAYTGFARAMYRTQLAAIQREIARDRERAAQGHNDSPAPPMVVVV